MKTPKTNSLTELARIARESKNEIETKIVNEEIKEVKEVQKSDIEENEEVDSFQLILQKSNEFKLEELSTVYIDREIHHVLSQLKSLGGVKISGLLSFILDKWIKENVDEINKIINRENKYLT